MMSEMKPVSFAARDGMRIEGHFTRPKTYKAGNPVPMIVHPHGGPLARDRWGFNQEVQFMANRGYAVLQVNFRNSTGYAMKLLRGGYKQSGEKTRGDIYDGAMWAITEGDADKDKVGDFVDVAKRANGDAKVDRSMFERTSPTLQITKIRAPVLHAYGGEDRNVDIANGEAVKKAFERAGLPVDYTFVPDEGHRYREDANVFMFCNKFDAFIKRNLTIK